MTLQTVRLASSILASLAMVVSSTIVAYHQVKLHKRQLEVVDEVTTAFVENLSEDI